MEKKIVRNKKNYTNKNKTSFNSQSQNWNTNVESSKTESITLKHVVQSQVNAIGIFEHEWDAIFENIDKLKKETSLVSIGNYIDGAFIGFLVPFIVSFLKIINSVNSKSANEVDITDLLVECKIYFWIVAFFGVLFVCRKIWNPKFLHTYKSFSGDIENLYNRICEINKRLNLERNNEKEE